MVYDLVDCSEALAFIGNSLLSPMSQTEPLGIEPAFWGVFPVFGNVAVRAAVASCCDYVESAQESSSEEGDPVRAATVEFAKLYQRGISRALPHWREACYA